MTCRRRLTRSDARLRTTLFTLLLLASAGANGCGGAAVSAPTRASSAAAPTLPATDADPPTFAPAPSDDAATGTPVGVVVRGRDDDARRVVLRMLEALRDRDVPGLEAVLADPLARAGGVIARSTLIAGMVRAAEANGVSRSSELTAIFDVPHALVEPLASRQDARRTSARYHDDDLLVSFPVRNPPTGRRMSDLPFVRITVGELVVRLTPEPRIVGL